MKQQQNEKPTVGAQSFMTAKDNGFAHCNAKQLHDSKIQDRDEMIEKMDEPPSPFKTILSIICILIGAGLGVLVVINTQNSIVGNGSFGTGTAIAVGLCLSGLGMITGEFLSSGMKKDSYTGRRKMTGRWLLGLLLAVIYVFFQYLLARQASIDVSEDMQSAVNTTTAFITAVAVIEVIFGYLFLRGAIQSLTLLFANIRIRLIKWKMYKTSKVCDESYNRHLFEVQQYNDKYGTSYTPGQQTESIKVARDYYNNGGKE